MSLSHCIKVLVWAVTGRACVVIKIKAENIGAKIPVGFGEEEVFMPNLVNDL